MSIFTQLASRRVTTGIVRTLAVLSSACAFAVQAAPPKQPAEFIDYMVEQHQFERDQLQQLLNQRTPNETILEAIQRPWEAKPGHQYYPIFLTQKRVDAGVKFWQQHQAALARAEQTYGVPAEIVVAIIGVETFYGQYKGKYSVLDSLYTLGFHYPPRADFFRSELEQYLLLSRAEGWDAEQQMGSYAGAMGLGQFISSSYTHYAVDFDNDGHRDLLQNPVDAIGSVANYFAEHGWQQGAPVAQPLAQDNRGDLARFVSKGLKPQQTTAELVSEGLPLAAELADQNKAKVFAFEQPDSQEYWLGYTNFYVITRYNHSPLYAMAVYQLSQQINDAYQTSQVQ